jgi:hypothetical protein
VKELGCQFYFNNNRTYVQEWTDAFGEGNETPLIEGRMPYGDVIGMEDLKNAIKEFAPDAGDKVCLAILNAVLVNCFEIYTATKLAKFTARVKSGELTQIILLGCQVCEKEGLEEVSKWTTDFACGHADLLARAVQRASLEDLTKEVNVGSLWRNIVRSALDEDFTFHLAMTNVVLEICQEKLGSSKAAAKGKDMEHVQTQIVDPILSFDFDDLFKNTESDSGIVESKEDDYEIVPLTKGKSMRMKPLDDEELEEAETQNKSMSKRGSVDDNDETTTKKRRTVTFSDTAVKDV